MASSIIDEANAESVAGEIVLLRAQNDLSAILILEGVDDRKLLSRFIDEKVCEIVISYGKQFSVEGLRKARTHGVVGVVAIVDRDYDDHLGVSIVDQDIIVTDDHDVEMMLVMSPAFDRVLGELASREKVKSLLAEWTDVHTFLRETVHPIGALRYHSLKNNLSFKFKEMKYKFVGRSCEIDNVEMIREIANHSRIFQYDEQHCIESIEEWRDKEHDRWSICCGHDFTTVFGRALVSVIGSNNIIFVTQEHIERQLRLAYSTDDFRNSGLFNSIVQWEQANRPFRVLDT